MDTVKAFNEELSGIYETKPPISRAKMTQLTKKAIKGIKFYKHIVQSMEKFVQKCRPEYKVPGLYVIDSVVRQSRHQFGPEKDVFMPRLCKNIITTFQHIFRCPADDKPRILRVLNLWQKNTVFPQDIVQQLMVMAGAPTPSAAAPAETKKQTAEAPQPDAANLTNLLANLLANPDANQIQNLAGLLSSSQQNQLEGLLKQVKAPEQSNHNEPQNTAINHNEASIFQPLPSNDQPPFLHTQVSDIGRSQPSFNREVLDFDYSDEESTPTKPRPSNQSHGIDPSLLAKLPTADQIQQLTAQHVDQSGFPSNQSDSLSSRTGLTSKLDHDSQRLQRLAEEEEIFNKQIEQISTSVDKNSNLHSSERGESHKRRRSRSRSYDRHHRHHRRRSHSRDRHRSRRSRSRDRNRKSRRSGSHERSYDKKNERKGYPPIREGYISVCTTTLWIGNISAKVMQHELQQMVEEYGEYESINMIPPRGCAYVCMKKRTEAEHALHKIRHYRLGGKSLKCDWAPSKEMPEENKSSFSKEDGVNYIALSNDPNQLKYLSSWGRIDPASLPEHKRDELTAIENDSNDEKKEVSEPVPAPAMVQAFGNPTGGMMPGVNMMPRPQVPMMVRPFQVGPFGVQRMGFPQRPPIQPPQNEVHEMKSDIRESGNTTPTADERNDDMSSVSQNMPRFQAPYGAVQVAQRFPAPMPVQIRMMPGIGQQILSQRMGVMPIRMGIPMQIHRPGPGFHPGMHTRIPMSSASMMAGGPMQPQQTMHQMQIRTPRFPPGGIRMHMPGQMRPPVMDPSVRFTRPPQPQVEPEREQMDEVMSVEMSSGPDVSTEQMEQERRGFPPHTSDRVPVNPDSERPSAEFEPPARDRTPREFARRTDFDRGPRDMDRHRRELDRPPPRDMDRPPPRDMDRPPPRDMDRPPRDLDRPPRDMDRPPRDMGRPPRDMGRPPRDMDRPPRDVGRRRPRSPERDRRDMDRRGRDYRRGGRDSDRSNRDYDRGREFNGRDRGPPFRSFRGRDDRGHRGNDRGFRGRGRGGWGRDDRQKSPEFNQEEEEYKRKRQETLRKRHEEEEDYVSEEIDLSSFGLPSGFGGATSTDDASERKSSTSNNDKKVVDDVSAMNRKEWLEEEQKKLHKRNNDAADDKTQTDVGVAPSGEFDKKASVSATGSSQESDINQPKIQSEKMESEVNLPPPSPGRNDDDNNPIGSSIQESAEDETMTEEQMILED